MIIFFILCTTKTMGFTAKARVTGTPSQITSFPNGSQLNPSLTFQGAQNSGLYHSGNGNVALSVNGTQQVLVHAGGLDVNGTLTGNGALLTGIITNNASLLTEGVIANERLPSTLGNASSTVYQGNGSQLLGLNNASVLTVGTLSQAVFPSTLGNASTVYQGNGSLLSGVLNPLAISNIQIADQSYTVLDDIAANLSGAYILVNGSGFAPGSIVTIGGDLALATAYVSATQLRVQTPNKPAGSYNVSVIRGDTITATLPLAVTYSPIPIWGTASNLGDVVGNVAFTKTLAATSDSTITFANTTSLPPQTTLESNSGIFSGNITTVTFDTAYSFTIKVTDVEFQDIARTFQLYYKVPIRVLRLATNFMISSSQFILTTTGVYGFGANESGQLGTGTNTSSNPLNVSTALNSMAYGSLVNKTASKIAVGGGYSLILCTDGSIHATGYNASGQLGNGTTTNSNVWINISTSGSLNGVVPTEIYAGDSHSLVLGVNGSLLVWGYNGYGQFGTGSYTASAVPINTGNTYSLNGKQVSQIVAGQYWSMVSCSDGTLHATGNNGYGQFGNGGTTSSNQWVQVSSNSLSGKTPLQLATGFYFSVVLATDGTIHATGYNASGQLGNGTTTDSSSWINVSGYGSLSGKSVSAISTGYSHVIALATDGTIHATGYNASGQLGNGTTTNSNVWINISTSGSLINTPVKAISTGPGYTLALSANSLHGFGSNSNGQLGTGDTVSTNVPIRSRILEYPQYSFDTSAYRDPLSDSTISFTVPNDVYSISAVCIGGGGGAYQRVTPVGSNPNYTYAREYYSGRGGDLRYASSIAVTPGETLSIVRGRPGFSTTRAGGESSIKRGSTVLLSAAGGNYGSGTFGSSVNGTGGSGGSGWSYTVSAGSNVNFSSPGGGGAGGYNGNGGNGVYYYSSQTPAQPAPTNSYAGGGGDVYSKGGGVGNLGTTQNPSAAVGHQGGKGVIGWGRGGNINDPASTWGVSGISFENGTYNGTTGYSAGYNFGSEGYGGDGHVRIIWSTPGITRSYPATNVE